jgi:membrane protease subunit (stomatin/prohibitin family)
MGLFNLFNKRQLLKVIEWEDSSKDVLVYRYPLTDRDEIMNSSTLVVRPSQVALFIHKGEIADIFAPGTYKLSTENIPIITRLLSLPTGGDSPIKAEIYYVNTKQFASNKWGTQNPIMMRDADYGNIRLRGFGIYSFKVDDAKLFMKEMFGTNQVYKLNDVVEYIKPLIIEGVTDAIAESNISALDLAANYKEFGQTVVECAQPQFEKIGLKLTNCVIENLSLPEDVEKALDERTKLGVLEDKMGTYTQMKAANAMEDAAKNTSGGNMAGLGIGLGAGSAIGNLFANNLNTTNAPKVENTPKSQNKIKKCVNCGEEIPAEAKFCSNCGAKQEAKFCADCGAKLDNGAKFCPNCGKKVE